MEQLGRFTAWAAQHIYRHLRHNREYNRHLEHSRVFFIIIIDLTYHCYINSQRHNNGHLPKYFRCGLRPCILITYFQNPSIVGNLLGGIELSPPHLYSIYKKRGRMEEEKEEAGCAQVTEMLNVKGIREGA